MVFSDFLSRQQGDNNDPRHIIPISFNMKEILKQNYPSLVEDRYLVQTRSQLKAKGKKVPAVHGTNKPLAKHSIPLRHSVKTRKEETKPIIIDDSDDDVPLGLDNKPEFGTQVQDATVTQKQFPFESTRPGIGQMTAYTHPNARPPQNLQIQLMIGEILGQSQL